MELHEILICLAVAFIGATLMMGITIGFRRIKRIGIINELEKTRDKLSRLYEQNPTEYFDEVVEYNSKLRYMKKTNPKNARLALITEINLGSAEEDYEI